MEKEVVDVNFGNDSVKEVAGVMFDVAEIGEKDIVTRFGLMGKVEMGKQVLGSGGSIN